MYWALGKMFRFFVMPPELSGPIQGLRVSGGDWREGSRHAFKLRTWAASEPTLAIGLWMELRSDAKC
jgi:hypothetical protein